MPDSSFKCISLRDMACTERELLRWLGVMETLFEPAGREAAAWLFKLNGGHARIAWAPLPDRVIALVRLKRLEVRLECEQSVPDDEARRFVFEFDRHTQRGGG
ncbi:hypothetical protein [Limnobacter sp.]|uniref:hypothetical protein n=1 Tax=Limnobacter sp. TaxID=2003368 RepID=UPI0025858862|nr:hypothetical protein [Limnobacter sp.]